MADETPRTGNQDMEAQLAWLPIDCGDHEESIENDEETSIPWEDLAFEGECLAASVSLATGNRRRTARSYTVPRNHNQAMRSEEAEHWREAEKAELTSLEESKVAEVVDRPPRGTPVLRSVWAYRVKPREDGTVEKWKARLCANGSNQEADQIYSPVAKHNTVRMLLAHAIETRMIVHHMDVVTAYLYGELTDDEVIYMEPPPGLNVPRDKVWRLRKSIYGLRQSARVWNANIDKYLREAGFRAGFADPCLYIKKDKRGKVVCLIALYVDDLLIAACDEGTLTSVKALLQRRYRMVDQGLLSWYLGMAITYDVEQGTVQIGQRSYIDTILERFDLSGCSGKVNPMKMPVPTADEEPEDGSAEQRGAAQFDYRGAIGCLLYVSVCTRPDISVAISKLARHVINPGYVHIQAVKRVMQYLGATRDLGLSYHRSHNAPVLHAYADSSYGDEDCVHRKSTSGHLLFFGGNLITWATYQFLHVQEDGSPSSKGLLIFETIPDDLRSHSAMVTSRVLGFLWATL
jgi:hypothetical protein